MAESSQDRVGHALTERLLQNGVENGEATSLAETSDQPGEESAAEGGDVVGPSSVVEPLLVDDNDDTVQVSRVLAIVLKFFLPEPPIDDVDGNIEDRNAGEEEDPDTSFWFDNLLTLLMTQLSRFMHVPNPDYCKKAIQLALMSVASQVSYLTWGYSQELIMTRPFNPTDNAPSGRFPSAAFCVFTNRLVALMAASVVVCWRRGGCCFSKKAPLVAFSPCALGNTLSSYCQYSALTLVSFPVVTLFRSCKIAAVMIVGKLLHGTRYAWGEYVEVALITIGVANFSVASRNYANNGLESALFGYVLLLLYIFCDAFTTQWQEKIYQTYGRRNVDPFQMILGVNLFALALTSISLLVTGEFGIVVEFLGANREAIGPLAGAAVSSTLGQLCIFVMIREFGPVLFTIVMTIRQMIAIVLSSMIFGHNLRPTALLGAFLVFATVAYQIKRNYVLARQPETLVA